MSTASVSIEKIKLGEGYLDCRYTPALSSKHHFVGHLEDFAMRIFELVSVLLIATTCVAATPISGIPGTRGVRIVGQAAGDALGFNNMSALGDINGDGRSDIAVAAPGTNRAGATSVGAVYVHFGADGNLSNLDVSGLNGTNGFKIIGSALAQNSQLGIFTTGIGDVNNDEASDLLIGSRGVGQIGRAYIIFGKPNGQAFPPTIDVSNLGSSGVVLNGASANDFFGNDAVSGGGDLNGDDIEDFAMGAEGFNGLGGIVYLIFGRSNWPAAINVGSETAASVVKFTQESAGDQLGSFVSIGADINNDSRSDLFINAYAGDAVGNNGEGKLYVVFGRPAGVPFAATQSVGSLNGSDGFQIRGNVNFAGFGSPVIALGDFNGDGLGDFAASGVIGAGSTALIYGKSNWDAINSISDLTGPNGTRFAGATAGDAAGAYLAAPGDVNGDGKDDLMISAPGADITGLSNVGKVYLIYGTAAPLASDVNLNAVESSVVGEVFQGSTAGFAAGPISAIGKFSNVDVLPDFLIGSETANGDVYVVTKASDNLFKNGFEN